MLQAFHPDMGNVHGGYVDVVLWDWASVDAFQFTLEIVDEGTDCRVVVPIVVHKNGSTVFGPFNASKD